MFLKPLVGFFFNGPGLSPSITSSALPQARWTRGATASPATTGEFFSCMPPHPLFIIRHRSSRVPSIPSPYLAPTHRQSRPAALSSLGQCPNDTTRGGVGFAAGQGLRSEWQGEVCRRAVEPTLAASTGATRASGLANPWCAPRLYGGGFWAPCWSLAVLGQSARGGCAR